MCRYATLVLIVQQLESLYAQHRHQQRTAQVCRDDARTPCILPAHQQRDGLRRKGGKGGQSAEKAGDDEQPPFRRQPRMLHEECDCQPDQVTADQIGGERAKRQFRQHRIKPQPEAPAQSRAECRADSYREKCIKCHILARLPLPGLIEIGLCLVIALLAFKVAFF